jgi:phage terminase small subunit
MPASKKKPAAKKAAATVKKAGSSREGAATRRRLFVEAYLANGRNGTEAAIAAGFSPKTAGAQACELLKHPDVQTLVAARTEKLATKFELTTEAVLKNLAQAIYFDPRKLLKDDGSVKAISELDDDTAMALAGFEVTEEFSGRGQDRELVGFTKKLKWLDKNAAREQAMKHLGLYREDNKQRNPLDGLPREVLKDLVGRLKGAQAA